MRRAVLLVALVLSSLPALAHADGWLSMRGAYYKEYSTRVVQPMIDAELETSDVGTFDVHALVDSITSASAATGSAVEWTEERYEGGAGYMHTLGDLRLGGSFRTSTESDYDSNFVGVRGELSLFEKNTVLALNLGRSFDRISNGVMAGGLIPPQKESLHTGLTSLSVTQLLSPQIVANLTWDFIDAHGYQANIYRRVTGGDTPVPELVPELRLRNAVYAGARGFMCPTGSTGVLGYRFYIDDWGIVAHTIDAKLIQELHPGLEARVRYRYYMQSAADFYREIYSKAEILDAGVYKTEDEKLSAFTTHTIGGQVTVALGLFGLEGTWSDIRLDALVDRIVQDTTFGNAWSVQLGMVVPFAY